jgi:uncharacterized protein (TIGR00369 family)
MKQINNNDRCFVCGTDNPFGFQIKPEIIGGGEQVRIECVPPDHFQGWANVLHGGILSTLMDEAITYIGIASFNSPAVTAKLEIRFKKPAPTAQKLIVIANRIKNSRRLIEATASITLENGTLIAEGGGKVMKMTGQLS